MRIIFMGSTDFSLKALKAISAQHNVVAVYSNPARPSGRGMKMTRTPVQEFAESNNITCFTPDSMNEQTASISALEPDVIVVAAYGFILPKSILTIAKYGCINIHASLLPKLRGAAPIQNAILNGDAQTGITIMLMDAGMDTGNILISESCLIDPSDTSPMLFEKLGNLGARLITQFLTKPVEYFASAKIQDHNEATYTKKITKLDMRLDFSLDAIRVRNAIRAFYPNAWFMCNGAKVKALEADVIQNDEYAPGVILDKHFTVSCGSGAIRFLRIHPESKREMSGSEFLVGHKNLILRNLGND